MKLRTVPLIICLTVLATVFACDSADDTAAPKDKTNGSVTAAAAVSYDGTSCNYDGPDPLPAGPATFTFTNDSDEGPGILWFLWQIGEGHTYDEFVAFYEAQFATPESVDIQEFPTWARVVTGTGGREIDRGDSLDLDATLAAGTYALDCELGIALRPLKVE